MAKRTSKTQQALEAAQREASLQTLAVHLIGTHAPDATVAAWPEKGEHFQFTAFGCTRADEGIVTIRHSLEGQQESFRAESALDFYRSWDIDVHNPRIVFAVRKLQQKTRELQRAHFDALARERRLIAAAAEAVERFNEDDLEAHAARLREDEADARADGIRCIYCGSETHVYADHDEATRG
jgi:hypothetical protein